MLILITQPWTYETTKIMESCIYELQCFRDLKTICTVGFEPNVLHNDVLLQLENQYQRCGWRVSLNCSL